MDENKLKFYDDLCFQLDTMIAAAELEYKCSLEGLNSNVIGRLFVSIVDTFGGLLKTWGTNLSRINKSLKRSELDEFVMSNSLKVRTVDNLPYDKCMDTDVDVPANMKGTYKTAVDALVQVYKNLNAINNGKLVDIAFKDALNSINMNDKKLSKQVESTALVVNRLLRASKPSVDFCLTQFEGKFDYKRPFSEVFLTSSEFAEVRKTLLDCEYRLQDVRELTEIVTSIEGCLKSIASAADANNTIITPADLKHMAETAKGIALVFDAYGMATTRQMALEHNYILCVNNLYDNVK